MAENAVQYEGDYEPEATVGAPGVRSRRPGLTAGLFTLSEAVSAQSPESGRLMRNYACVEKGVCASRKHAPATAPDRASRRAFYLRRMKGRTADPIALQELWDYRPEGRWKGEALLQDIPYAVIGGVATRMYMPERTTADIDVLVEPENFERALSQLVKRGYARRPQPLGYMDTRLGLIGQRVASDRPVDVLSSSQPWVREAVATVRWEDGTLPIVDLPYLIALKLDASRSVDQGDLSRMLGFASEDDLARVKAVIRQLLPADADDLELYILLGKHEVGRADPP